MVAALEILAEVEQRANASGEEILRRVARRFAKDAEPCGGNFLRSCYIPNAEDFARLLRKYIVLRRLETKYAQIVRRRYYGGTNCLLDEPHFPGSVLSYLEDMASRNGCYFAGSIFQRLEGVRLHCMALKEELRRIWPCESCIHKFNPTRRAKHGNRPLP